MSDETSDTIAFRAIIIQRFDAFDRSSQARFDILDQAHKKLAEAIEKRTDDHEERIRDHERRIGVMRGDIKTAKTLAVFIGATMTVAVKVLGDWLLPGGKS